jgi:plastocyanin
VHTRHLVVAAIAALAAAPASASAETVVEAQTVWRFGALSYTIDQGEPVLFRNADAASPGPHNVTASDAGPDGKPLFQSSTIENGGEAPVTGAPQLTTGSYDFICSVHPFMQATLEVSDKGTPAPPPGSSPAPSPPAPSQSPPPADGTAPKLSVTLARATLKARRLKVGIRSDEASDLDVKVTARAGRRTVVVGRASGHVDANRPAALTIRVSRSARRALRGLRRARLTVAVEGRDAAGNVGTAVLRRTLKR